MLQNRAPPDTLFWLPVPCVTLEFHGFNSSTDVLELPHFGSCYQFKFFTDGIGPFKGILKSLLGSDLPSQNVVI